MHSTPPDLARSALDAAPDAMVIIDSHGTIRFANRQLSALFGYAHDEMVGKPIELLMPGRFRERHIGHRIRYGHNLGVRPMGGNLELFALRQDGSEFPVEISLSPIQDAEQILVGAAIRDITERNRARAELVVAREAAEHANQGKSRFLATASHDLRQPLQTLALLNGSLRRLVAEPDALEAIAQQELAISAMSRLLNALLDISKLESGAIQPNRGDVEVTVLFDELKREYAGIAAQKDLVLKVEPSADCIHTDRSLIEQILRNLLSNAIKYTHRGEVRLRCCREAEDLVRVEVADTGIGIPADQLPYICDEFYQVGVPTNSTRDGYGLGLSIVRRLVALLGIGFEVRSDVGQGSTFSLLLPASSTAVAHSAAAEKSRAKPQERQKKRHVLLVEDDVGVRDATRMLLRVEGYRVTAVATLAEALAAANADPDIDLLLTDYHLGDETGTQVIKAVRESLRRPLNAVLMTGDTSTAMSELSSDPNLRVASKPIKADELLGLLG